MKHAAWFALAVVVAVVSFGCQQAGPLSEQDKAAIEKQHGQYAQMMNTGDPAADAVVKTYYAPDATVLPPNVPAMRDLDAVAKMMTAPGGLAKNFKFSDVVVDGRGDLAYAHGYWEGDFPGPGGAMTHDRGKFLETWKRQADGTWKAAYDMWNSDMPPGFSVPTGEMKADAGPEVKNLAWFAGAWQLEFDAKESPLGPAGKGATRLDCRWFVNGQTLVCTNDGKLPAGDYHEVMLMGYDPGAKAYSAYDLDNAGVSSPFALAFQNNAWTMTYELKMGGKPAKMRVTIDNLTKDAGTFKQEFSTGGAWTVFGDGTCKRVGG